MPEKKEIKCPNCGSTRCIKNGKVKGKQTYLCKDCFSRFSLNRKRQRYPDRIKKEAVAMYKEGYTLSQIARKLNVKVQTVHYWLKAYRN
ncbi:MAG: IS1 family transposase [Aquificae bacterium]|nr:IS1 family transposase [Aquificota bacterium]